MVGALNVFLGVRFPFYPLCQQERIPGYERMTAWAFAGLSWVGKYLYSVLLAYCRPRNTLVNLT